MTKPTYIRLSSPRLEFKVWNSNLKSAHLEVSAADIIIWLNLGKSYTYMYMYHQNWDFAVFSICNVRVTSLLSMSIYNIQSVNYSTFVTQPLILPILRSVKFLVCILTIANVGYICKSSYILSIYYILKSRNKGMGFLNAGFYSKTDCRVQRGTYM